MFEPLRQLGRTNPDDLSGKFDAVAAALETLPGYEAKKRARPPTIHRETARANAAAALDPHEAAITDLVNGFLDRVVRVTKQKIVGKKAREGTRHYKPPGNRGLLEMKAGEEEVAANILGDAGAEDAEHILPPAIFNLIRWRAEMQHDSHPVIAGIISDMAKQAYDGMQSELAQTIIGPGPPPQAEGRVETELGPGSPSFNESLKPVRDAIQAHTKNLVGFTDTVAQNIRDEIAAGENEGLSIQQIANNVADMVQQKRGYWTERIARTETTGAANEASMIAAQQIPAVNKKQWLSAHDNRVREPPQDEFDHVAADGETVPIDEPFTATGEDLMFPGDPDGSAGNVINCRCTMIYTIGDDNAEIDPFAEAADGAKYSPDQPRDSHGRFGEGGDAAGADLALLKTAAVEWSQTPRPLRLGAADVLHVDAPGYHEPRWPDSPQFNSERQRNADLARSLLRAVRDAPPSTKPLYRGLDVGKGAASAEMKDFLASARPGATIDMPLAGFSRSANTAIGFSGGDVVVQLQPGATAFNESAFSPEGENEVISGGRFQVTDVRDANQNASNHYLGDPYDGDGHDIAQPNFAHPPGAVAVGGGRFVAAGSVPGPITITIKQLDTFDPDAGSKSLKGSDYEPYEFDYLFLGPASKPSAKYSPDQPRDSHGRFGSGDASLDVDRMTMAQVRDAASAIATQRPQAVIDLGSHDHPAPITVRGVTWHGRPERKPNLEDAARHMSLSLSKLNAEQRSVLKSIAHDNAHTQDDGRVYTATVNGQKYNVTFERADAPYGRGDPASYPYASSTEDGDHTIAGDHPEAVTEVLDRVTGLAGTNPPPNLTDLASTRVDDRDSVDIFVGEIGGPGTTSGITMGATVPGGGMMMLNDDMILNPQASPSTADNVESGWSPPNAANADVLSYVLTHEWGHLTDSRTDEQVNADWLNLHGQRGAISQYGATEPHEFYAEGWADYQLGPDTAKPASLAMAKEYGWTRPT